MLNVKKKILEQPPDLAPHQHLMSSVLGHVPNLHKFEGHWFSNFRLVLQTSKS